MRRPECDAYRLALAIGATIVVAAACDGGAPGETPSSEPPAPEVTTAPRDAVPEDRSLHLSEYLDRGVPDPGMLWTARSLSRAAEVLWTLAEEDARLLPRINSPQSGALFDRMVSPENLDLFTDRSLALPARVQLALGYLRASGEVSRLYSKAFELGVVGDSEMVAIQAAELYTTVVMLQITREFVPTLDRNDPAFQNRRENLRRMRHGVGTAMQQILAVVEYEDRYRASERAVLLVALQDTLPSILPELPPKPRIAIVEQVAAMTENKALGDLRFPLAVLLGSIEEYGESTAPP